MMTLKCSILTINFRVALDQGEERGWYSYLDMSTFFENLMFQDFLTKYFKSTGKVRVEKWLPVGDMDNDL